MLTLLQIETANKGALREACREVGIAYTTLNVDAMRDALRPFASDYMPGGAYLDPVTGDDVQVDAAATLSHGALVDAANEAVALDATVDSGIAATVGVTLAPVLDADYVAAIVVPRDPRALFAATKLAKVEKVRAVRVPRAESNGVKRPADATLCGRVWGWCDTQCAAGVRPEAKVLRAALADIDPTTCTVQYYRWRKFNGISGR